MEHDDGSSVRKRGRVRTGVWVGVGMLGLVAWLLALPAVYLARAATDPPLRPLHGGAHPGAVWPLGSVMPSPTGTDGAGSVQSGIQSTLWETAYHSALGVDPRVELVPGQTYPFVHAAHGVIDQTTGVTISVINTESSFLGIALYYGTMSGSQAGEATPCPTNYPVFFSGSFRGHPPQSEAYIISKCTIPPHPSGTRVWYRLVLVKPGIYRYLQADASDGCEELTPLGQCIQESFFFPRIGV